MPRRNKIETDLLKQITERYLRSGDFNGVPLQLLLDGDPTAVQGVRTLIQRGLVEIIWDGWDFPHIKRLYIADVAKQLEAIENASAGSICVYPTRKYMRRGLRSDYCRARPFTRLLALGYPQLEPMFFDMGVLDRYQLDPRYSFQFDGLDGSFCINEEYYRSRRTAKSDKVSLESFGLGVDRHNRRIIVAFLRYLSSLTPRHQQHWYSHKLTGNCKVESNYFRRMVLGEWTEGVSVYQALLEEFFHINRLCEVVGLPSLFKQDFSSEKPKGFGLLIRPTRKSYLDFAHTLDKMVSENLSPSFFEVEGLELKDDEGRKGTIRLLEEWLNLRIRFKELGSAAKLVAPFKTARKLRQPGAHSILKDEYSSDYEGQTAALAGDVYTSISNIRFLLLSHPKARNYQFPAHLDSKNILIY